MVVDAFSSDAIPLHLLTVEAMKLYLSRLSSEGALLFHVSNRYVDLSGALAQLASANNAVAFIQSYEPTDAELNLAAAPSDWVWIAEAATSKPTGVNWRRLSADANDDVWTDRYSHLLGAIAWEQVLWF